MNVKEAEYLDQSRDLFRPAEHADYTITVVDHVVCIEDKDSGRSVTNDADAVIEHIVRDLGDRFPGTVIYKDLSGVWDQMLVTRRSPRVFAGFRALSTFDRYEAIKLALVARQPAHA